jgi:uncharacterized protein YraI
MNATKYFRTIFSAVIFLMLLAGSFAPGLIAQAASEEQGIVTASLLNFRKGPGFNYDVLKMLENGQKLTVFGKSGNELWLNVRLPDGKEGWVYGIYVQVGDPKPADGASIVDNLNLRAGPGTNYRILDMLDKGQAVTVLGRSTYSEWLVVRTTDGTEGWVFRPFIETNAVIASLPVSEAYGGPTGSTGSTKPLNIVVTIRDNDATVQLSGFPKSEDVVVKMGQGSEKASLKVASGSTDTNGKAELSFNMPKNWPDGASTLVVSTEDGKFSRTANIIYYK